MTGRFNDAARLGWHAIFHTRRRLRREVSRFAHSYREARVLELGSGKPKAGRYRYSSADLFHSSNEITRSDVRPEFGHTLVDCTTMEFDREFDVVLCCNVLEHVYDYDEAIRRIHRALKPGGRTFIATPFVFPLHDEPGDYWRFTEHALRRMLRAFADVRVWSYGPRRAPLLMYAIGTRPKD